MKNYSIILAAILLLSSCNSLKYVQKTPQNVKNMNEYITHLINEGYSLDWATHKAEVEQGFKKCDQKYLDIQND